MFKFLKDKIKEAVSKFSKKTESVQEEVEVPVEQVVHEEVVEELQEQKTPETDETDIGHDELEEEQAQQEDTKEQAEEEIEEDKPEIVELHEPESKKEPEPVSQEEIPESIADLAVEEPQGEEQSEISQESQELFEEPESEEEPQTPEEDEALKDLQEQEVVEQQAEEEQSKEEQEPVQEQVQEKSEPEPEVEPEPVSQEVEQEVSEEIPTPDVSVPEKKPGFFKRIFGGKKEETTLVLEKTVDETPILEERESIPSEAPETFVAKEYEQTQEEPSQKEEKISHSQDLLNEVQEDATKKKKGFFAKIKEKITKFQLTEEVFEEVFWDFELALLENNVALEVIEKVKKDMHDKLTQENVTRKTVDEVILDTLKDSLDEVLTVDSFDLLQKIQEKKDQGQPMIMSIVGVNGSGKTTTLAKLINLLQKNNFSVVVAASDTFRAAAIQQLEEHTNKLGVKLIKHDYNADPSAVAYDAISHAKSKNIDVVLIDTAGRLQSNSNLMDELKKLIRVNKPDLNIFIGESVTGNDCVEQAMAFNDAVGIDGIILSKADIDEKGGAAISVSYVTKRPILYIGTGQTYDDLKPFKKEEILANLGL